MIELWQGTSQGSQGSQVLREELGAGGERVELPPCKFWPPAEETAVPVVASIVGTHQPVAFWNEDLGLHPLSPLWNGVSKMMIRNVPARTSQCEMEDLLRSVTGDFRLQMPRSSERKCKGYAFVEGDCEMIKRLAAFLWQGQVPTRRSTRPLKIHPADGFDGFDMIASVTL